MVKFLSILLHYSYNIVLFKTLRAFQNEFKMSLIYYSVLKDSAKVKSKTVLHHINILK